MSSLVLAACAQGGGQRDDAGGLVLSDAGTRDAGTRDAGTATSDAGGEPSPDDAGSDGLGRDAGTSPGDDAGTTSPGTDAGSGHCNPVTSAGCPSGLGCRITPTATGYTTRCEATGTFGLNTPCDRHIECPAGSECSAVDWSIELHFCYAYCTTDADCTVGLDRHCQPLPGAVFGGQQFGTCY